MAIYVDGLRNYYFLRGTGIPGLWCHMVTDGYLEELHLFAQKIGIHPRRFQNHPRHPHYDLMPIHRKLAVEHGAIEVNTRELYKILTGWQKPQSDRPIP